MIDIFTYCRICAARLQFWLLTIVLLSLLPFYQVYSKHWTVSLRISKQPLFTCLDASRWGTCVRLRAVREHSSFQLVPKPTAASKREQAIQLRSLRQGIPSAPSFLLVVILQLLCGEHEIFENCIMWASPEPNHSGNKKLVSAAKTMSYRCNSQLGAPKCLASCNCLRHHQKCIEPIACMQ